MLVRSTEDTRKVNEVFSAAFLQPAENGPGEAVSSGTRHYWGAFDEKNGEMFSTLTVSDYSVHFDWGTAKMGGIGGVATLPQYRRQGGIRECFRAVLRYLYDNNYDFSYLLPFSNAFYRQFGYESCVRRIRVRVKPALLKPDSLEGRLCLADASMLNAIRRVDQVWEARYNMAVVHEDEARIWVSEADPARTLEYTYLYFDRDGVPQAYVSFCPVKENGVLSLRCSRFFFLNREGFQGIMELFRSMAADYSFAEFVMPGMCNMEYLLPEWSMGALEQEIQPYGMVRVINAEQVLWKCHCHGCVGRLTVELHDPMLKENSDTFTVDWKDGHVTNVARTTLEPDAVLDISSFSALIAGACDLDQAELWMKGLKVLKPEAYPSLMFYLKPMMMTDFF